MPLPRGRPTITRFAKDLLKIVTASRLIESDDLECIWRTIRSCEGPPLQNLRHERRSESLTHDLPHILARCQLRLVK